MFYVNIVHGRPVVVDLEQAAQEERWRVERERQRDAEYALAQATRRDAQRPR